MIFQPTNIIPDEVNGSGCVDLSHDVTFSWQVNGDSAMNAYKIDFYQNDASSTAVASTGKVDLTTPFWGRDASGNIQRFEVNITSATLSTYTLTNGHEYKFLITQYWGTNNSVTQLTASVFIGRDAPELDIDSFNTPVATKEATFTATYTQTQGDAINSIRWMIAEEGYENEFLLDTGNIVGTGLLSVTYDGFFTGVRYGIRCIVTTQNDMVADTGWEYFDVSYQIDTSTGIATACQLANENAVFIEWDQIEDAHGYSVMRQTAGQHRLKKIADVDSTVGQIRDYSAKSGETYIYYIYPEGQTTYMTGPQVTSEVTIKYWFWAIIEAEQEPDGSYYVLSSHYFRFGDGGIKEADISNNNLPTILKNFTRYPTRQPVSSNYRTGSITGYVGTIGIGRVYSDKVADVDALMELSNTENYLFLTDPKGHFLAIQSNGEITAKTDVKKHVMPQTVTFPWIEVENADEILLVAEPGHQFYPSDEIMNTSIEIRSDGALIWTYPDDYRYGSQLSVSHGALMQDTSGSFTEATLVITENMILQATVSDEEEEQG